MNLYEMTNAASQLYEMLSDGEIDEQIYNDTLENIGVEEKLESYCKIIKQFENDEIGIATEIDRLKIRRENLKKQKIRMENAITDFLLASGAKKANAGTFLVSYSESTACNIMDEKQLPSDYIVEKHDIKYNPDKAKIKQAILNGTDVPGAVLVKNKNVHIK